MLSANNANVYTDFNGLANLKTQARQESPEALKEVAKQFESIFLGMVLKGMRDAKLADGIMDSDQSRFFRDMYDKQLSIHLAGDPGIGLANLIVKQLSPDQSPAVETNKGIEAYRNHPVITNSLVKKTDTALVSEPETAIKNDKAMKDTNDATLPTIRADCTARFPKRRTRAPNPKATCGIRKSTKASIGSSPITYKELNRAT